MSSLRRNAFAAVLFASVSPYGAMAQIQCGPKSPIDHVIVIVGENHTFDNVFGAYLPRPGRPYYNLLSRTSSRPRARPAAISLARPKGPPTPGTPTPLDPHAHRSLQQAPPAQYDLRHGAAAVCARPALSRRFAQRPIPAHAYAPTALSPAIPCIASSRCGNRSATTTERICLSGSPRRRVSATTMTASAHRPTTPSRVAWRWASTTGCRRRPVLQADGRFLRHQRQLPPADDGRDRRQFLALVTGDAAFYNVNGRPADPPTITWRSQMENPNPQPRHQHPLVPRGRLPAAVPMSIARIRKPAGCCQPLLFGPPEREQHKPNCAANTYYLVNN